jgi:hypothetical protein
VCRRICFWIEPEERIHALADTGNSARVVWKARLPASVSAPVIADVDNDGASEILVSLGDGRLCLLRGHK